MKKLFFLGLLFVSLALSAANPPIYIAFQWHMHQPIYVPGQNVIETDASGSLSYPLINDVFNSRVGPYTTYVPSAINKLVSANLSHAGAQVSFSGSLIENLNVLEASGKGYSNWKSHWRNMISLKTALGNQRLDMVAFGYHHPLMALTDEMDIRKQIQKHKAIFAEAFPGMPYSKGIFPPENAFEIQMVKPLVEEGLEWVMVDNAHFDRACIGQPWVKEFSIVEPNKADQINPNPNDWKKLTDMYAPGSISAAWGHRPHWIKYVDPATGQEYKMIAVPTSLLYGNEDGRGGFGALQYEKCLSQLEAFNTDPDHPILVVMHHDGDNHGGGSSAYYSSNFQNFTDWVKENPDRFVCTTVQDYLDLFPPAADDMIHVESGSWYGAGADPEFLKWNGDPGKYILNGTTLSDNYSPDRNSWSVITAAANIVKTAEQINPNATGSKEAWDFLTVGQTSCYWYWDGSDDWDSHPTRASNYAAEKAMPVIAGGNDQTPPSIYHPQRQPYNPGATEWGFAQPSDFTVWSYVYDVSGLTSVKLKYRLVDEGYDALRSNTNKTYAGGAGVGAWQEIVMTESVIPSLTTLQPTYKANEYSAEIKGLNNVLIDYYVEAVDVKGNVGRSIISHVWIGENKGGGNDGGGDDPISNIGQYIVSPINPTVNDLITFELPDATEGAILHWGVNKFEKPIEAYLPSGSVYHSAGKAARTPFVLKNGKYVAEIGPFNNAAQEVNYISFVVNYTANNTWDNNGGADYQLGIGTITGIGVIQNENTYVSIYPTPVTDVLNIETNAIIQSSELIALYGSTIRKFAGEKTLMFTDIPTGIYLLQINFDNGTQKVMKVIKK